MATGSTTFEELLARPAWRVPVSADELLAPNLDTALRLALHLTDVESSPGLHEWRRARRHLGDPITATKLGWRPRAPHLPPPEVVLEPRAGDPRREPSVAPPGWICQPACEGLWAVTGGRDPGLSCRSSLG